MAINLAGDLTELGEFDTAQSLSEDTLNRSLGLLGENHPLTMGSAANLSVVLRRRGESARAEELQARTLDLLARVRGADHLIAMPHG